MAQSFRAKRGSRLSVAGGPYGLRQLVLTAGVATLTLLSSVVDPRLASPAHAGPLPATKPSWPANFVLPPNPIVSSVPPTAASSDVGYLPGAGAVEADGSYSYEIPIEAPEGLMMPHLALRYSSRGGNGVVGVGWSLTGLSAITRCRQNMADEGVVQGVHMTDLNTPEAQRDRFCLDGQKLVALQGGYRQDGTEYRTHEASNTRIVSHTSTIAGPDTFTVTAANGTVSTYAAQLVQQYTARTNGTPNNSVVSTGLIYGNWLLTRQVDTVGNGIRYNYNTVVAADGGQQIVVSSIQYTTHSGDNGYRSVSFGYNENGARPDIDTKWQEGVKVEMTQLLTSITLSAPDPTSTLPVWKYVLGYQASGLFNRSLLSSIKRCGFVGGVPASCTWSKNFAYTSGFGVPQFTTTPVANASSIAIDMQSVPEAYGVVSNMGQSGLWQRDPAGNAVDAAPIPALLVGDFDGDGASDVLVQPGFPAKAWSVAKMPLLFTGSRQSNAPTISPLSVFVDLNNVGDDLFKYAQMSYAAWQQGNVGEPADPNINNAGWVANVASTGNLEHLVPYMASGGTGATLLMIQGTGSDGRCGFRTLSYVSVTQGFLDTGAPPVGSCAASETTNPGKTNPVVVPVDVNGDGLTDFVVGQVSAVPNPLQPLWPSGSHLGEQLFVALNQAGSAAANNGAGSLAALGAGDTHYPGNNNVNGWGINSGCPFYIVDLTGDGRSQILGSNGTVFTDTTNMPPGMSGLSSQNCKSTGLYSYSPYTQQYTFEQGDDASFPTTLASGVPLVPSIAFHNQCQAETTFSGILMGITGVPIPPLGQSCSQWSSISYPTSFQPQQLYFGDFNGDGLEDVVIYDTRSGQLSIRYNIGRGTKYVPDGIGGTVPMVSDYGFTPPQPLLTTNWQMDQAPYGHVKIDVADLNRDGYADLLVFHDQPSPAITMILFGPGGAQTVTAVDIGGATPGVLTAAGYSLSALGDFNGDGLPDIVQAQVAQENYGANQESIALQMLLQQAPAVIPGTTTAQPAANLLSHVWDEGATTIRESVVYSAQASDKPEGSNCRESYPQRCVTNSGYPVVRSVSSTDTDADSASIRTHQTFYSYERLNSNLRDGSSLGFGIVRIWDPARLQQTITEYDNTTETGTPVAGSSGPTLNLPSYYPGVGHPLAVTTVTALPAAGSQTLPKLGDGVVSTNARVVQTAYHYQLATGAQLEANNAGVYAVWPPSDGVTPASVTSTWEQQIEMVARVTDPSNPTTDFMWGQQTGCWLRANGCAAPLNAVVDAQTIDNGGIDAYGNVLALTEHRSTKGGEPGQTTRTLSSYANLTTGTWLIGELTGRTVIATEADPAVTPVQRQVGYRYDSNGLLQVTTEYSVPAPGQIPVVAATTTLGRDSYGNVTSITKQTSTGTRQVNVEYDRPWGTSQPDERVYPSQFWVPYSLPASSGTSWTPSAWVAMEPARGVPIASIDANGVESSVTYDDQNRPRVITPPVGAQTFIQYAGRVDASPLGGFNGMVTTRTTGGQTSTTQTDSAGRTLRSTRLGFDGSTISQYIQYDILGRPLNIYRPYVGSVPPWQAAAPPAPAVLLRDGLDRLVSSTTPDNQKTSYSYRFMTSTDPYPVSYRTSPFNRTVSTVTVQDPNGFQSQADTDVDGRRIATVNYVSGQALTTSYHYAAFGLGDQVTLPSGAMETSAYDSRGNRLMYRSPDSGIKKFGYNGFDQVTSVVLSGATTSYSYDWIGRPTGSSTTDWTSGNNVVTSVSLTYDSLPNGLGKLGAATSYDGGIVMATTTPAYDQYGRAWQTTDTVMMNGTPNNYSMTTLFDTEGRVSWLKYPIGNTPGMWLKYNYNAYEYLSSLQRQMGPGAALQTIYTVNLRNADDSLAQATLSAANQNHSPLGTLTYNYVPQTGQLQEIKYQQNFDQNGSAVSSTAMDVVYGYYPNGLVNTRNNVVAGLSDTYSYDEATRLSEWDVNAVPQENYGYDADGNLANVTAGPAALFAGPTQNNSYGGSSGGPHALSKQTNAGGTTVAAPSYDLQGRQTSNGAGRTILYNAFDLPKSLTSNGSTTTFQYDAAGNRASKSGASATTIYGGGGALYEKRSTALGVTDVYKIPGIGQVEVNEVTGEVSDFFTLTDMLGSVSAIVQDTSSSSKTSQTITRNSYTPFGGYPPKHIIQADVHDGFTGQEQDDEFGLINFRGRLYDANLKRFLSTDPIVSAPDFGQSWNPYSYVHNSTPNFTDPSGFDDSVGESDLFQSGPPLTGHEFEGLPVGDQQVRAIIHDDPLTPTEAAYAFPGFPTSAGGSGDVVRSASSSLDAPVLGQLQSLSRGDGRGAPAYTAPNATLLGYNVRTGTVGEKGPSPVLLPHRSTRPRLPGEITFGNVPGVPPGLLTFPPFQIYQLQLHTSLYVRLESRFDANIVNQEKIGHWIGVLERTQKKLDPTQAAKIDEGIDILLENAHALGQENMNIIRLREYLQCYPDCLESDANLRAILKQYNLENVDDLTRLIAKPVKDLSDPIFP